MVSTIFALVLTTSMKIVLFLFERFLVNSRQSGGEEDLEKGHINERFWKEEDGVIDLVSTKKQPAFGRYHRILMKMSLLPENVVGGNFQIPNTLGVDSIIVKIMLNPRRTEHHGLSLQYANPDFFTIVNISNVWISAWNISVSSNFGEAAMWIMQKGDKNRSSRIKFVCTGIPRLYLCHRGGFFVFSVEDCHYREGFVTVLIPILPMKAQTCICGSDANAKNKKLVAKLGLGSQ